VPNVTNINLIVWPDVNGASRLGASCPRVSFLGTGLPAAGAGIGTPAVVMHAAPRVRGKVVFTTPPQAAVTDAQLGQANLHNYMTRVYTVGEGASGPPTYREPA
jgi:type IV secretory pathway protease TraF